MTEIVTFKPKTDKAYLRNLTDFIDLSKNALSALSEKPTWSWENLSWEGVGSFTKHGYSVTFKSMHKANKEAYMSPAFTEFAKAFIRYTISTKGGKVNHFLLPLRALEESLLRVTNTDDITKISNTCLLYTSPSPRDLSTSRMPSSA